MAGRPSLYTPEITAAICRRLMEGESLRAICRDDAMPSTTAVCEWLAVHKEFAEQYARAREVQADTLADEILEIADDASNDWMQRNDPENPGWVANHDHIQRSRLRVDSRKWYAGKVAPKKYGDKLDATVSGSMTVVFDDPTSRPDGYHRKPVQSDG